MRKQAILAVLFGFAAASQAALVDDFESYSTGVLTTVASGVWTGSTTDAVVDTDGANQYAHWANPAGQVWIGGAIPAITDASTATVFFRMYAEVSSQDVAIGLSVATGSNYGDLSPGIRILSGSGAGTVDLGAYDGTADAWVDTLDYLNVGQWYNVWIVTRQADDRYDIYVNSGYGDATGGDLFASNYEFRSNTTEDLSRFLSRVNFSASNFRIDDIHWSAGQDLTNPVAPPAFELVSLNPANGATGVYPKPVLEVVLADGSGQVDTGSIVLSLDGTNVAPNVSKVSGTTTVSYAVSDILDPLSVHTAQVAVADIGASLVLTSVWNFTVSDWATVPPSWGYPTSLTSAGERGFWHRDVSYDDSAAPDSILPNTEARANAQLLGRLVNPDTGELYTAGQDTSEIEPTSVPFSPYDYWRLPEDDFDGKTVVNMNNDAEAPGVGNFFGNATPPYDDSEGYFPGIFFVLYDFADETIAYLELDPGIYTFGVNSDDGFVYYIGPEPRDVLASDIGRFDGGRGPEDTQFSVVIDQAGLYPFRLLHYQGGGGAALELFTVNPDGSKVLVNDDANGGVRAWRVNPGTLPPYISWISPLPGTIADTPNHRVSIELTDGDTAVDGGTISLALDGAPAAFTTGKTGNVTTVTYSDGLPFQSTNHFTLVYSVVGSGTLTTGNFEVVTGEESAAIELVSTAPEGVENPNPINLEVVLADRVSQVDTGAIELYLDGSPVSESISAVDGITTVSFAAGFLEAASSHTGTVVYAGTNPAVGPYTNEWDFTVEGFNQVGDWFFIEDFEPYDVGQIRNVASPPWFGDTSYANIQSDLSGQRLASAWGGTGAAEVRGAWREVPPIDEGTSGTYYVQIATTDTTPSCYWGMLTTTPGASTFGHEAECGPQIRLVETNGIALAAMDGANQTLLATGLSPDNWYGIWLVVDNAADTYDVYYNTIGPDRSAGSHLDNAILGATGLAFRNGGASTLTTFIQEEFGTSQSDNSQFMDNLRYDPNGSAPGLIGVEIVSVAPTGKTYTNQPVLEAALVDVYSEVDDATIVLTLDGNPVTPDSISKVGTTTTVSYATGTLGVGMHTAGVAVAGKNPVSVVESQAWTFEVAEAGRITYVDATAGAAGNTTAWDNNSMSWIEWNPPVNGAFGVDNEWEQEPFANGVSWFESNREATGGENAPQLRTSVTGLPGTTYDVYAYFWRAGGQPMILGAALTNNPAGELPLYQFDSTGVAASALIDFSDPTVLVTESDRTMYQVYLGTVTGTRIDVYLDDSANSSTTVWYDGIGYAISAGAVVSPPISVTRTGTSLTLTWPAEYTGWTLEKNIGGLTVPADWTPVPGSTGSNVFVYSIDVADGKVFFRLAE